MMPAAPALPHVVINAPDPLFCLLPRLQQRIVFRQPQLPTWLRALEIHNLRIGPARVDAHVLRGKYGGSIEAVLAHPQSLAQCHGWLNNHLPDVERRAVASNAEGARLASTNPAWAAIAGERAGAEFGLHTVAHAIQDDAFNRTRFAVVCLPQTLAAPEASGKDCVSLIVSVPNRPGAVHDLLVPLKQHGVSMTRFESRPTVNRPTLISASCCSESNESPRQAVILRMPSPAILSRRGHTSIWVLRCR